jgi:hypothetical protein
MSLVLITVLFGLVGLGCDSPTDNDDDGLGLEPGQIITLFPSTSTNVRCVGWSEDGNTVYVEQSPLLFDSLRVLHTIRLDKLVIDSTVYFDRYDDYYMFIIGVDPEKEIAYVHCNSIRDNKDVLCTYSIITGELLDVLLDTNGLDRSYPTINRELSHIVYYHELEDDDESLRLAVYDINARKETLYCYLPENIYRWRYFSFLDNNNVLLPSYEYGVDTNWSLVKVPLQDNYNEELLHVFEDKYSIISISMGDDCSTIALSLRDQETDNCIIVCIDIILDEYTDIINPKNCIPSSNLSLRFLYSSRGPNNFLAYTTGQDSTIHSVKAIYLPEE